MKTYDPAVPLISIHVPKCAGSSFGRVLKAWYGRKLKRHYPNSVPPPAQKDLTRWIRGGWKRGVCVHGHFNKARGFGVASEYPDIRQYITVLRDPFEVELSNYFYGQRKGVARATTGPAMPVDQLWGSLKDYLDTRLDSLIPLHMPSDMTLENWREIVDRDFVYIGIAEDLQTTINVLATKLGFDPVHVPTTNASPRGEALPDSVRDQYEKAFRANNTLAYALYSYALNTYTS